jgi:hypothetical protein
MVNVKGPMMGMTFQGMGCLGYDNMLQKFVAGWIDNMGTGIMRSEGTGSDGDKTITFTGQMMEPMTKKMTDYKYVYEIKSNDEFTMRWWAPSMKDGKMFESMTITYSNGADTSLNDRTAAAQQRRGRSDCTEHGGGGFGHGCRELREQGFFLGPPRITVAEDFEDAVTDSQRVPQCDRAGRREHDRERLPVVRIPHRRRTRVHRRYDRVISPLRQRDETRAVVSLHG